MVGVIIATTAWAVGGVCAQPAEELSDDPLPRVTMGVEADISSRYFDRGMLCSEGAVSQTSAWVSASGLTGSVWMNYDFNAAGGSPSLNEVDLALAWGTSLGSWDIEPSIATFSYPRQPDVPWTAEVSLAVTWNLPIVQPFTVHRLDCKEYPGAYFGELGVQTGAPLFENLELDATLSAGWASAEFNEAYLGGAVSAMQVAMLDAGLTWNPVGGLYLWPHFTVATMLDADVRNLMEDATPVQLGLSIGGEF